MLTTIKFNKLCVIKLVVLKHLLMLRCITTTLFTECRQTERQDAIFVLLCSAVKVFIKAGI